MSAVPPPRPGYNRDEPRQPEPEYEEEIVSQRTIEVSPGGWVAIAIGGTLLLSFYIPTIVMFWRAAF